ncbi:DUF928 domain-containing protein [Lyngbya sp. CCY1209]|uniref:DUF928 domain-containing protein n=1 Tax=Lyngbya sp. CCY1209 TaxID=2886103 RepID=UPI002D2179BA|nr:DUF928 domain-containing protein [Lyngbya sp. CCY1209]MEB3883518.1 DUF928 domain-containing protein [Lyngbya sp. CCY1209]
MAFTKSILSSIAIVLLSSTFPSIAQSDSSEEPIQFIPQANREPPESDSGPGTRGICVPTEIPLTAVVGRQNLLDLTLGDRPTFWIYIPYSSSDVNSAIFSLQDEAGEVEIWGTQLQLKNTPGIVAISPPETVPPLEVSRTYRWYFEMDCAGDSIDPASPPTVSLKGVVTRVSDPAIETELKSAQTAPERARIYARNGLWYDAVTALGSLLLEDPQNAQIRELWTQLLGDEEAGLEDISREPIAGRAVPQP